MTIQEAIADRNRPLSMSPQEWVQYSESREHEIVENVDETAEALYAETFDSSPSAFEKAEIGLEQMVLGCRIAMRAFNEIERMDLGVDKRKCYDGMSDIVRHAIAPYLADMMKFRKGLH